MNTMANRKRTKGQTMIKFPCVPKNVTISVFTELIGQGANAYFIVFGD